uniref:Uncharacterized protein n=1 Tax=viral metagenome TaxID=1070528 RepID=A0A6C0AXP1_9ZZZZ|tara:strand:- start:26243 stop:26545 length:303 start_codon:yes stop_codon:yes gene_type:complete
MYLIPLVRTSRAIAACTLLPDNPLLAITTSEIISYTLPFINNSPIHASNNMILFLFYYFYYNESALELMNDFKKKYIIQYKLESISILIYLFFNFINKIN